MKLLWQKYQTSSSAVSLDRIVQTFRLDRERPRILIVHPVNEQNRCFDLVRIRKRRHAVIDFGRLPVRPAFILETEGRKRTVVSAATCQTRREQICVCQQIGRHKCTIGMSSYPYPVRIDHPFSRQEIYGGT